MLTKTEILKGLNEQQKAVVLNYNGPIAVSAGPGSGKSRVLVNRCAYMLAEGIPAQNILMFTFTKKAANELKERVINFCGQEAEAVTISTYHSFCGKILRRYADLLGWTNKFTIFDDDDKNAVLANIINQYEDDKFVVRNINSMISHYKERMISPTLAKQQAESIYDEKVASIYEDYMAELKNQNAFDFDDLIYFTIRLFEQFPNVINEINRRYTYISCDEVQDSSPRDLLLIKYLSGKTMNLCCVGDDDQSIYSFRGVAISKYYEFIKEYNLKRFILGRNYRSTQTIVNASQSMIYKNQDRLEKNIFSENKKGDKIAYVTLTDEDKEANFIAKTIRGLIRLGYEYKDIAILYRMSYLSRKLEKDLVANHIPYDIINGCPFYSRMEIKDIVAYLRVLTNPKDLVSLERILNVPKRGIGDKSAEIILNACHDNKYCDTMNLIEVLKTTSTSLKGKAAKGILNLCSILEQLCLHSSDNNANEVISKLIDLTQYFTYLKNNDEKDIAEERIGNVIELTNVASSYNSVEDFLNNIIMDNNEETEEQLNKVNLMTMHASKGLEFPVVIICDANQNIIPHKKAIEADNIEEERRLFYVAMTRAKEFLFIVRPEVSFAKGLPIFNRESQFIKEIDSKYIVKR